MKPRVCDILLETGMAHRNEEDLFYVKLDHHGILQIHKKSDDTIVGPEPLYTIENETYIPYHKEPEIRPEKAGELWENNDGRHAFVHTDIGGDKVKITAGNGVCKDYSDFEWHTQIIHGKNGWTRLYPPVPDPNVERIELEVIAKGPKNCFTITCENLESKYREGRLFVEYPKEKP